MRRSPKIEQALESYRKVLDVEHKRSERQRKLRSRVGELEEHEAKQKFLFTEAERELGEQAVTGADSRATSSRRTELKNALEEVAIQIAAVKTELDRLAASVNHSAGHPINEARSIFFRVVFDELRDRVLSRALPDLHAAYAALKLSTGLPVGGFPDTDFNNFLAALQLPVPNSTELDKRCEELKGLLLDHKSEK